ncbi:hypothetical protein [Flavobacterium sp. UBA6135]|uniref:hypothetical protein n=1 Tax=Flavobacterium sp. UBA6135 TaxID=1946553 RepID=UPI0025C5AB8C|nr:hypothetical protein [Flavobacterium sp. UBA6135]
MKGVFKENKDLIFIKEEFNAFLKKKKQPIAEKQEEAQTENQETLILEEVEL